MTESWLPIVGFEDRYEVSNLGRVRRIGRFISTGAYLKSQMLILQAQKNGYYRVTLISSLDNKPHKVCVHRLVARAFVGGYAEGLQVNHIDEDKSNNKASNLEWMSPKENTNYGTCLQRRAVSKGHPVYQCSLDGEIIERYETAAEAEKKTGIDHRGISKCCRNRIESFKGYRWSFSEKSKKESTVYTDITYSSDFVNIDGEVWKTVCINGELFPNYEVSNKGRVRTIPRAGYSKVYKLCHPYLLRGRAQMTLRKEGKKLKTAVSRIVAFAFCEDYKPGYQANHKDENPLNDCANNLEWVSVKDNINYGERTQKVFAKLSKKVAQMDDQGNIIQVFPSLSEAERIVGGRIKDACKGRREKAKGFRWKYLD